MNKNTKYNNKNRLSIFTRDLSNINRKRVLIDSLTKLNPLYLAKSNAVIFTVEVVFLVVLAGGRYRSTLIFNAIMIPALIPLSTRGVTFRPEQDEKTFTRNMLIYDLGGVALPFVGIKAIDLLLALFMR